MNNTHLVRCASRTRVPQDRLMMVVARLQRRGSGTEMNGRPKLGAGQGAEDDRCWVRHTGAGSLSAREVRRVRSAPRSIHVLHNARVDSQWRDR